MTPPFPPVSVGQRLARDVFEAFLGAAFALSGVGGLLAPSARAQSIVSALPRWAQAVWYGALLAAGVLVVTGLLRGRRIGLELRRAGLLTLAGQAASYAVASAAVSGWHGLTGSLLLLLLAVACVARACQLSRDIALVARELAGQ